MRFSSATLLALPLLVAATQPDSPFEQAKAQAQQWFTKFSSYFPSPSQGHATDFSAATARAGGATLNVLTLDSWEDTIRSSAQPGSSAPEEWWVFVTGGNKTCFGRCGRVEKAFNEFALLLSAKPSAPHLAYLNCEAERVLCNTWGVVPPNIWVMEVSPKPAPVDIRIYELNTTTTDVSTFTDLHASKSWKDLPTYKGYFHPFDGQLAQYGLALPLGYALWVLSSIPSWMLMLVLSFASRNFMTKRALGTQPGAGRPATGNAAPAPAGRVRVGAPQATE